MEEQVKNEEIKVEVVESKKKFFTKKRVLAIGGAVAATIALGAVLLLKKGNGQESEGGTNLNAIDTTYESVTNSEVIE